MTNAAAAPRPLPTGERRRPHESAYMGSAKGSPVPWIWLIAFTDGTSFLRSWMGRLTSVACLSSTAHFPMRSARRLAKRRRPSGIARPCCLVHFLVALPAVCRHPRTIVGRTVWSIIWCGGGIAVRTVSQIAQVAAVSFLHGCRTPSWTPRRRFQICRLLPESVESPAPFHISRSSVTHDGNALEERRLLDRLVRFRLLRSRRNVRRHAFADVHAHIHIVHLGHFGFLELCTFWRIDAVGRGGYQLLYDTRGDESMGKSNWCPASIKSGP